MRRRTPFEARLQRRFNPRAEKLWREAEERALQAGFERIARLQAERRGEADPTPERLAELAREIRQRVEDDCRAMIEGKRR